jgi:hypothetical protein
VLTDVLRQTRTRATECLAPGQLQNFEERVVDLRYHVEQCALFYSWASKALFDLSPAPSGKERAVYLMDFAPENVARCGDVVIREAATCSEITLRVVGTLCGLGVDDDAKIYGINDNKYRKALQRKDDVFGSNLIGVLDRFDHSIGFETLQTYRNWVTHAGAPRVFVPEEFRRAIPVPEELGDPDERAILKFLRDNVLSRLMSEVEIATKDFAPPAASVINAHYDRVDETMNVPFIHVDPGGVVENLTLENVREVRGGPMTASSDFLSDNTVSSGRRGLKLPGFKHPLTVYGAGDYLQAIRFVTLGLERFLTRDLDSELVRFLGLRVSHRGSRARSMVPDSNEGKARS